MGSKNFPVLGMGNVSDIKGVLFLKLEWVMKRWNVYIAS